MLPQSKQHYAHAITDGDHADVDAAALHHAGVLRTGVLTAANTDPATRRAARDIEAWLAGARRRGFDHRGGPELR